VEAKGFGDTAYEVGKYTLSGDSGKVNDRGKYIVIWRKVGGQWKLYRDIFNTN
jgi:ketosteroid isomerase-like protein